jgi:hypothetical protein
MKLLNISIIIISIILSYHNLLAQSDVIAKIGYTELTKNEFRLRYELSPRVLSNSLDNSDSLKLKFLYSLVAEKLWAIEALDKGLANTENFKFYYSPIEKIYIRDELFRVEVKDKVEITDRDLTKGLSKYVKILQLKTLASNDSSQISDLYSQLIVVGSIDSLFKNNSEIKQNSSEIEIKFGDLGDETLEDELYQLKINEFTAPFQNDDNWFIFELKGTKTNIPEVSQDKFQNNIEEIIRNRKTRNLYNDFYKKYFSGYTIEADDKIFHKLSEEFYNIITSGTNFKANSNEKYFLTESDILKAKELLGMDFLNQKLFKSKYGSVKAYDFLSDLTIVDVSFDELSQPVVNKVLSNELKRFMQQETVYRIGKEIALDYSSEVKSHLEMWRDNLLSQMLKNSFNSQIDISENEVIQYYNEVISDSSIYPLFNLRSISTHSIAQVEEILNLIEDGKSFEQVSNELEIKEDIYEEDISDFKKLRELGMTSDIITELEEGEIFGPIKTGRGYTIIKLNVTSKISDSLMLEQKKEKDQIRQNLYIQKLNKLLNDKSSELANKYGLNINEDFIFSEKYSNVNLFVHRYMGFGGRIAAVPFTTPSFKWYYQWKIHSKLNP